MPWLRSASSLPKSSLNGSTNGSTKAASLSTPSTSGVERPDRYKWVALINTTLGSLMVTIDGTIVLIAMPDIFRGIGLNPLLPGNSFYLLWMILGFLVVTSTLVVSLGRLGDLYGRVKIYNLGFALFTFFSLLLSVTWMYGDARRAVADHHADLPGRRWGDALCTVVGDPD